MMHRLVSPGCLDRLGMCSHSQSASRPAPAQITPGPASARATRPIDPLLAKYITASTIAVARVEVRDVDPNALRSF